MPRFKVGDKVTIRQWEDMEKEYGINGSCIQVPKLFTPTMKMYCGNTYTIKSVRKDYYVLDGIGYYFSDEMFEESKAPKYWMVKGNPGHPLHDKFIRYMNLKCGNVNKNYYILNGEYYGFDGSIFNNGYVCVSRPDYFENNPVLITLEEWDKWFGSEVEDTTEVQSGKPKYWVVKRDKSNPLFQKCLNYLNETYGTAWTGNGESYGYYGFDGWSRYNDIAGFENNPVLITLEEWDKWFGSEVEDTTEVQSGKPKYWAVKRDKSNPLLQKCLNYLNETYGTAWTGNGESYDYYGFDGRPQYDNLESFENNPKLITLEEWDKWFGSEVSSDVKLEFKVGDRVYVKDTSVWCPGKFGVIIAISGVTMSHCVKLDSGNEFYLNKEDLVKCEVATDVTGICSDIGTTLTQETLQNELSVSTTIPQNTATSYIELYDLYNKILGSGPTEAEEEPTSIFTFKKLK